MAQSIKDRVAIVGMGCSKFGERWDCDMSDLMVEAAWFGTVQSGRTGQPVAAALKLDYIPITRVENACCTGTDALRNAVYAVAAGIHDIVLAIGVEKLKDTGWTGLGGFGTPGSSMVEPNVPPPVQFAQAATRYAYHYDMPMDDLRNTLARIAVKNHKNGALNPKAHFQREITMEKALNAPMIAFPLGLFDCCGVSDGAAAAIITTPEIAKKMRDDYMLVKGIGMAVGGQQGMLQDDYDFVHFEENVRAAKMAYEQAGIMDPLEEIDMAMVHDCFTITELVITEDLGFAPRGKGPEYHEAGTYDMDGELAINIDGGLKCFGHPIGASGIRMIYEVYKQLQGKAEKRQRKNPKLGLTHNLGGRPGSFTCTVAIFGRDD